MNILKIGLYCINIVCWIIL